MPNVTEAVTVRTHLPFSLNELRFSVFSKDCKVGVALKRVAVARPEGPCPTRGVWGHPPPGNC